MRVAIFDLDGDLGEAMAMQLGGVFCKVNVTSSEVDAALGPRGARPERILVNLIGTFSCITKSAAAMVTLPVLDDGDRGAIVNTAPVAA